MKVIVTGGGTGGHIYPAIAIAKTFEKKGGAKVLYLGNKIGYESQIVPKYNIDIKLIPSRWILRKKNKVLQLLEVVKSGFFIFAGLIKSLWIMYKFKPDYVIGTGGFVCFPVVLAGKIYGAKCFIHEQNAFSGLANRKLESKVEKVLLGFLSASKTFANSEKCVYVGNPVRDDFQSLSKSEARKALGLDEDKKMIFAFGGSQGAYIINEIAYELGKLVGGKDEYYLVVGSGLSKYEELLDKFREDFDSIPNNVKIINYIDDMHLWLNSADFVIGRGGALSLAEITLCGKPSLLVPLPEATDNHQYFNCKDVAEGGGAILALESSLKPQEEAKRVMEILEDKQLWESMSRASYNFAPREACEKIYEEITKGN